MTPLHAMTPAARRRRVIGLRLRVAARLARRLETQRLTRQTYDAGVRDLLRRVGELARPEMLQALRSDG